ncbi:helix-turn-helix domain protein [Vibrio phage 1.154.O._10N.222.52.B12]|nr:helix-turn-helix domain protein [Vibrio phage 1.154.O._10N.222.52.B12]
MNIGKSIKIGLAKKDCHQMKAAREVGVSEVTMSNWKNGKCLPSVKAMKKISDFFGVSLSEFISWGEQ